MSRSSGKSCRRSSHSYGGENRSRTSLSSADSRSYRNFNDSSNNGADNWKGCSSSHRIARANRNCHRRKGPRPGESGCQFTVLQPQRGSVRGRPPPSRPSSGEKTVWWRLLVPCALLRPPSQRSRARFMVSRESLPGSFETDGHGWISAPLGRMKLGHRAEMIPARPGPNGGR